MRRIATAILLLLLTAAPAHAFRLGDDSRPVSNNPADHVRSPIDDETYDEATHCAPKPKPGMVKLTRWMERHARGVSWGTYRCERWGKHSASLHAENRALDWDLDVNGPADNAETPPLPWPRPVTVPADKAEARRLIRLLLAPDRQGNPHALARRMGVEE